jgi:DNA-binding NtrC family response regulator
MKVLVLNYDTNESSAESFRRALSSSEFPFEFLGESISSKVVDESHQNVSIEERADIIVLIGKIAALMEQVHSLSEAERLNGIPLFAVIENGEEESLFQLLQSGFDDFVTVPFSNMEVVPRLRRLASHQNEKDVEIHLKKKEIGLRRFIGSSTLFLSEINKIPLLAQCDVSILITGETGTGKELCARAIHYLSPRSGAPFMAVNCGAIPLDLVENELFGHERGAFTGANTARAGIIEEAEGGTVFLDEIDCLTPAVQVKLLRFLQEKEYRRLGSSRTRKADVRILAAMNSEPPEVLASGTLRQDLYYRLNVVPLVLPPLRKRKEDIPLLARHFLMKFAREFHRNILDFSKDAMALLVLYDWPGNVREMEHLVQRAVILSPNKVLQASEISIPITTSPQTASFQQAKADMIASFESNYIKQLLAAHGGNIARAAFAAKKHRRAFWELIRKHHIDVNDFCQSPRQR